MGTGTNLLRNRPTMLIAAVALSVGAYVRRRVLGADLSEEAALKRIDALIGRMEDDLDSAIEALSVMSAR